MSMPLNDDLIIWYKFAWLCFWVFIVCGILLVVGIVCYIGSVLFWLLGGRKGPMPTIEKILKGE